MTYNVGYHQRRTWALPNRDFSYPVLNPARDESNKTEWSRILWSIAKTGFVSLPRKNLADFEMEDDDEQYTFNLGGVAEPRRPDLSRNNVTTKRKPQRQRKPTYSIGEGGSGQTIKKKQTAGLPWLFNLVGPPGNE